MRKRIISYDSKSWSENMPPTNIPELISWLQKKLHEIPEECRPSAELEREDGDYYIEYYRDETEEEKLEREREVIRRNKMAEEQERENLRKLIAKYGTPTPTPP